MSTPPQTPLHRLAPRPPAETAMPYAPTVTLPTGRSCVPQHYLEYRQSAESLAQTLALISCRSDVLLFGGADAAGSLFVQAGVIGHENYQRSHRAARTKKIVYGRKWRIEAYTPTSELVQTAFLAIKKAREHELRELFSLHDEHSGKASAALSCHLDLPLLAHSRDWLAPQEPEAGMTLDALVPLLAPLRFAGRAFEVLALLPRPKGSCLLELRLSQPAAGRLDADEAAEFDGLTLSLLLQGGGRAELIYAIMDALIAQSDRHIEESFRYEGFARFSRRHDPLRIARLSIASRPQAGELDQAEFLPLFQRINDALDADRAPPLGSGALAHRNRRLLAAEGALAGVLPRGY